MRFLLFFFTFIGISRASESRLPEVVADGKRLESDSRSVSRWGSADLEREAGRPLGELLREASGVDFTIGTAGNSGIQIRGASHSQALVLIDGVKANDPSTPNRVFDWTRLDVSTLEKIEILKGPQAVSYGSDAIGGVVLITTKRGRIGTSASFEAGSETFLRTRVTTAREISSGQFVNFQAMGKGVFDGGPSALSAPTRPALGKNSGEAMIGGEVDSQWSNQIHSRVSADFRIAREELDQGAFDPDPNMV
ncbi:MAG: TonB-dependent receptor, partial [Cryobacterium sp.]|nr:TonB-dependent receptor [Oligoflexia bacterium]